MLGGNFRLIERLRIDEVADRFRLRQIDAAVEEGTHRELPRLCETRSGSDAEFDDVPQNDWRTVGGDFDDVISSVRVWLREVCDHDFVDALGKRRRFLSVRPTRFDELSEERHDPAPARA